MKKLFVFVVSLLFSLGANAQFVNGQVLTAPALNNALANPVITGGSINGVNIGAVTAGTGRFTGLNATSIGATTPGTGAFTTLSTSGALTPNSLSTASAAITGGTIDGTVVGGVTPTGGTFTTLSVSSTVSGTGFTARFSSPGPIGNTSASTGAFTTITATGTITPSSTDGIVGTTTNNNANAGSVGEFQSSFTTGTSVTSGVVANIVSISLTAGDWDVTGVVQTVPAGTTTTSLVQVGVSTVSGTFATVTGGFNNTTVLQSSVPAGNQTNIGPPVTRISLSSTTTVYLVAQISFAVSTMAAHGFIRARRVR